jgi:hypothetical protein
MVAPLRCGGLSVDADGDLITGSGRKWADIQLEHDKEHEIEYQRYLEQNKDILKEHGTI